MRLFCFRKTRTFNLEKRQHRKTAGQAVSSDSGGSQKELLKRMYGAFSFSVTETENSLPLMAYGRMQTICNLTCMFICGFLLFPSLIAEFLDTQGLLSGKGK